MVFGHWMRFGGEKAIDSAPNIPFLPTRDFEERKKVGWWWDRVLKLWERWTCSWESTDGAWDFSDQVFHLTIHSHDSVILAPETVAVAVTSTKNPHEMSSHNFCRWTSWVIKVSRTNCKKIVAIWLQCSLLGNRNALVTLKNHKFLCFLKYLGFENAPKVFLSTMI